MPLVYQIILNLLPSDHSLVQSRKVLGASKIILLIFKVAVIAGLTGHGNSLTSELCRNAYKLCITSSIIA